MASRRILKDFRLFKDNGDVCTDGSIAFYDAGTTTPRECFSDRNLSSSIGTSEACDVNGWAPAIYVSTAVSLKLIITGTGVTTKTFDYYEQAETVGDNPFDLLVDPGADSIAFWDESANDGAWLSLGSGLSISGTTLSLGTNLTVFHGVTAAADKGFYFTGASSGAVYDLSSVGRTLVGQSTQALMRTTGLGMSAAASAWVTDTAPFEQFIYGLITSNNGSDATNDIDIGAGVCADANSAVMMRLSAALTKRLDANWAAGTNQGMRYSGAAIADTTYHIYLVMTSSGTVDVYADPSVSPSTVLTHLQAETGGSSYAYARRIASIKRTSGSIQGFYQRGDEFLWTAPAAHEYTQNNPGTSAVSATINVPSGIQVISLLDVFCIDSTPAAATAIMVSSPDVSDIAPVAFGGPFDLYIAATGAGAPNSAGAAFQIRTNSSAQVRLRLSASTADHTLFAAARGYIDSRGKY